MKFVRRPKTSVMIGANHLSALYIKLVRSYSPSRHRVVAVIDDEVSLFGRRIAGVPVVSTIAHIERTIEEFEVHGVCIDRIIVGGDDALLSKDSLAEVERVCHRHDIELQFVPHLIGLDAFKAKPNDAATAVLKSAPSFVELPSYHRVKRFVDFFVSAIAIVLLLPVIALISLLVLIDLGSPVVFWQQRLGRGGTSFFLYKFRTLHPPYDRRGLPVSEDDRLSWIGRLLRNGRLDELPQLFNVLVGEMSLIGPRPLLPEDQPTNSKLRLLARPGLTGWAQVNGGNLVTNDEKGALDEWYVWHASLWLDLLIVGLTLGFMFRGERRSEPALRQALLEQRKGHSWKKPASTRKIVREELGPALRGPLPSRAKSIKIRAQLEAQPDQLPQQRLSDTRLTRTLRPSKSSNIVARSLPSKLHKAPNSPAKTLRTPGRKFRLVLKLYSAVGILTALLRIKNRKLNKTHGRQPLPFKPQLQVSCGCLRSQGPRRLNEPSFFSQSIFFP